MKLYSSFNALILLVIICKGSGGKQTGLQGSPGEPRAPADSGFFEYSRRWKQCAWVYTNLQDNRDYGQLLECDFNKLRNDSYLRVVYMGNTRIAYCTACCKRWYITFNDAECSDPATIDGYLFHLSNLNIHRPTNIEGYCGGIPAGKVQVGLNVGDCLHGGFNPGNAWTGSNQASRIIIEEVEPPVN